MRLGLKTLLTALLVAALVVPAATAKPGGAKGHGGGKPAWAGSTSSSGGGGKPEWAGQGKGHAKKAEKAKAHKAKKAASALAEDTTADEGDVEEEVDGPKHDNPAWTCKFERDMMGLDAFADKYGTNPNKANAFGKCVSEEAHARDGVTEPEATTEPAECIADEEATDEESPADEGDVVVEDETADEDADADEDAETVDEECAPADEGDSEGDTDGETEGETDGDGTVADEEGSEESEVPVESGVATLVRNVF